MANCFVITNPTYLPRKNIISSITKGFPTTVVTTTSHRYVDGEIVRLKIPFIYGMQQINNRFGSINIVNATTFEVNINSFPFNDFDGTKSLVARQCAEVIPIGEINSTLEGATNNIL